MCVVTGGCQRPCAGSGAVRGQRPSALLQLPGSPIFPGSFWPAFVVRILESS